MAGEPLQFITYGSVPEPADGTVIAIGDLCALERQARIASKAKALDFFTWVENVLSPASA